jgi:hypothetical protein
MKLAPRVEPHSAVTLPTDPLRFVDTERTKNGTYPGAETGGLSRDIQQGMHETARLHEKRSFPASSVCGIFCRPELANGRNGGKLGKRTIGKDGEVILGPPTTFDAKNIDKYNF